MIGCAPTATASSTALLGQKKSRSWTAPAAGKDRKPILSNPAERKGVRVIAQLPKIDEALQALRLTAWLSGSLAKAFVVCGLKRDDQAVGPALSAALKTSAPDSLLCGSCSSGQDFASSFLQTLSRNRRPCLWLMAPTSRPTADFQYQDVVHAGRTTKSPQN